MERSLRFIVTQEYSFETTVAVNASVTAFVGNLPIFKPF